MRMMIDFLRHYPGSVYIVEEKGEPKQGVEHTSFRLPAERLPTRPSRLTDDDNLFKRYLKTAFDVQKHIALVNMSYDQFVIDWHFYKDLIES